MGWSEFKKFGTQKYDLGTSTSTWDIPTLIEAGTLPKSIDYTKLSKDDFIVGVVGCTRTRTSNAYANATAQAYGVVEFSHDYDSDSGLLTIYSTRQASSGNITTKGASQIIILEDASNSYADLQTKTQTMTAQAWLVY